MSIPVPLRCDCGAVAGEITVSPGAGNHCVCFCDDCQAFAAALGREDVLDAWGGTDIYQTAPARLRITQGQDELRALRLNPKGLVRWYTACCKTPVGNMMATPRSPFVGVISRFIALDAEARDKAVGPVTSHVMGSLRQRRLPAPRPPQGAALGDARHGQGLAAHLRHRRPQPLAVHRRWRLACGARGAKPRGPGEAQPRRAHALMSPTSAYSGASPRRRPRGAAPTCRRNARRNAAASA